MANKPEISISRQMPSAGSALRVELIAKSTDTQPAAHLAEVPYDKPPIPRRRQFLAYVEMPPLPSSYKTKVTKPANKVVPSLSRPPHTATVLEMGTSTSTNTLYDRLRPRIHPLEGSSRSDISHKNIKRGGGSDHLEPIDVGTEGHSDSSNFRPRPLRPQKKRKLHDSVDSHTTGAHVSPPQQADALKTQRTHIKGTRNKYEPSPAFKPQTKTSIPTTGRLEELLAKCSSKSARPNGQLNDTPCSVLDFFGAFYHSKLGVIIHPSCWGGIIIPLDKWETFVIRFKFTCSTPKANAAKLTKDHISKCLGIDTDQSVHTLQLPPQLEEPIEMSSLYQRLRGTVMFRFSCPFSGIDGLQCTRLVAAARSFHNTARDMDEFMRHVNTAHGGRPLPLDYCGRWSQKVVIYPSNKEWHDFLLPKDWKPAPNSTEPPPSPFSSKRIIAPTAATWPAKVGFVRERDNVFKNVSFRQSKDLIALPSLRLVRQSKGEKRRYLEMGLRVIHKQTEIYLRTANHFVTDKSFAIRLGITTNW